MLICHCRAVNDRAIRDAIAAGARRPEELALGCGAGGACGGCIPTLLELFAEHSAVDSSQSLESSAA